MRLTCKLACTTALVSIALALPQALHAQQAASPPVAEATDALSKEGSAEDSASDTVTSSDIIVVGVRKSIEAAVDRKRKSRNIVDSVVAEDAGKLPDNNVPEAIARIPGVNIVRSQGQGGQVTIRALQGVQTTINGNDVSVGERALSLTDIPAELIKSIDIYKSRDATQQEGGIGGTVNVELRRPLDLKRGLTAAGSIRGLYDDRTDKISPYASALLAGNFDSGIGRLGFLLNGSYTKTLWNEGFVTNESPDFLFGNARAALPASARDTAVAPFRVQYGADSGERKQPAFTGTLQWQPSDQLTFVFEGQYFGSRTLARFDSLDLQTREGDPIPSNVQFLPSGAIRSFTLTRVARPANPDDPDSVAEVLGPQSTLPGGVVANQTRAREDTYVGTFETHWNSDHVRIDFTGQYQRNRFDSFAVDTYLRFLNARQAVVDFASPLVPGGGPRLDFVGVNEADPAQLVVNSFTDREEKSRSDLYIARLDVGIDVDTTGFFRVFKMGSSFQKRDDVRNYGYRTVEWNEGNRPALSAFTGVGSRVVDPQLRGVENIAWATIRSDQLYANWDQVRPQIIQLNPRDRYGPESDQSLEAFFTPSRPFGDRGQEGRFKENIFAAYAQMEYGFDMGFPVDGFAGVRFVNTWGSNGGTNYDLLPLLDDDGNIILNEESGRPECCRVIRTDEFVRANFVDILPSAGINLHFTPKLQMRGAYNYQVQRPSFYALRNFIIVDRTNPNAPVYAGNPQLKPTRDHNFSATLEWYPRDGSAITLGGFYKRETGFIYPTAQLQAVPQLGGLRRRVEQERNAGPGEVLGFEGAVTTPFYFLPGALRNFGVNLNATFIPVASLFVPDFEGENFTKVPASFTSKYSTNAILFFDTPKFSARLAYNWRSPFRTGIDTINPNWIQRSLPTQRLDAAINYTPFPFMTVSLEGTNLLRNNDRFVYNAFRDLPVGLRQMSRTVQASVRVRY